MHFCVCACRAISTDDFLSSLGEKLGVPVEAGQVRAVIWLCVCVGGGGGTFIMIRHNAQARDMDTGSVVSL
jgi:hypothetical protein